MVLPLIARAATKVAPSTRGAVSNVAVFPKKSVRRDSPAPSHEVFTNKYAEAGIQPQGLVGANDNDTSEKEVEREWRNQARREAYENDQEAADYQEQVWAERQAAFSAETNAAQNEQKKSSATGKVSGATTQALALARNTPTALWMASWHTWFWLSFQIPLALLGLMFFVLEVGMQQSWLSRQFASFLSLFSLNALSLFMVVHTFMLGVAFFGLILTMIIYLIRGQPPLGGDRSTAKAFAILGCLMGYAMPLLNFFPWIGIYIFVMWTSRD